MAMEGGTWTIVIQADSFDLAVQRTFQIIPSLPQTVVVTVRETPLSASLQELD
jgi:hypothetical protein